ncbi:MAG: STAS domain-containing protein [Burkholderiales bacterium]|nr:STAS domain-containing protein [Burkholderiales bacterium]
MATIALPAVLTIGEASAALARLQQAIADDPAPVLDASALKELDTSAVAVLLECQRTATEAGKRLQLVGAPPKLGQLAQLYGVDALIGR